MPVLDGEDRQHVVSRLAPLLLAEPRTGDVAVKLFHQVRPAFQHRVVDRHRADDLGEAARHRLIDTEERDHIRPVGVPAERGGRLHPGAGREEHVLAHPVLQGAPGQRRRALIGDLADHLAACRLEDRGAKMTGKAEMNRLQLVRAVARNGQPAQQHDAAPMLQLVCQPRHVLGEPAKRKVLRRQRGPIEAPRVHMR